MDFEQGVTACNRVRVPPRILINFSQIIPRLIEIRKRAPPSLR